MFQEEALVQLRRQKSELQPPLRGASEELALAQVVVLGSGLELVRQSELETIQELGWAPMPA